MTLEEFFQDQASLFNSGDLEGVASCYRQPLAVFANNRIRLAATRHDIHKLIFQVRCEAIARGAPTIRGKIVDAGTSQNGRQPVLIEWDYLSPAGEEKASSRVRYFCREDTRGRWQIEMVEYMKSAFPSSLSDPDTSVLQN